MMRQRTIKEPVTIEGIGLQTGNQVSLTIKPAPAGSGISFTRTDIPDRPRICVGSFDPADVCQAERRTALGFGPLQVQTTEHLLAALSGLSIDNAIIELDNSELPGLDGSAKGFVDIIKKAGFLEQDSPKRYLEVRDVVWCVAQDSMLAIFPDTYFKVSYTLSYPGIGAQYFSALVDEKIFEEAIAPARTFCSEAEALELLKRGLGKGANYENTLVMGASGPIKNTLRFPDEPARHKVLDLIGDLYLAGAQIKGYVVAIKSGHKLNMEMVKKLKAIQGA
ncbi:MAG: UDP-3-O-acyl-N-acetylglucosamine deacetylase [Candidatus Omnitrophica bacterium]|nr:UDP-3-O-acyl-N-acetylglucosamine deacetylase [Candidatus Omnitrophota bacterium]